MAPTWAGPSLLHIARPFSHLFQTYYEPVMGKHFQPETKLVTMSQNRFSKKCKCGETPFHFESALNRHLTEEMAVESDDKIAFFQHRLRQNQ